MSNLTVTGATPQYAFIDGADDWYLRLDASGHLVFGLPSVGGALKRRMQFSSGGNLVLDDGSGATIFFDPDSHIIGTSEHSTHLEFDTNFVKIVNGVLRAPEGVETHSSGQPLKWGLGNLSWGTFSSPQTFTLPGGGGDKEILGAYVLLSDDDASYYSIPMDDMAGSMGVDLYYATQVDDSGDSHVHVFIPSTLTTGNARILYWRLPPPP